MKKLFVFVFVLSALLCAYAQAEEILWLPLGLEIIEEEAFCGADSINEVILPPGTQEIHSRAFADSSLDSISIPASVTFIAEDAFEGCDITQVRVPTGSYAAEYLTGKGFNLHLLTVESRFTIKDLGGGVCQVTDCDEAVWGMKIPEYIQGLRVVSVGSRAFANSNLTHVSLPVGLREIGSMAFDGCSKLWMVSLPEGLEIIGDGAFQNCGELSVMSIPSTVREIAPHAFHNCFKFKHGDLPAGLETLGEFAFFECGAIESAVIPKAITEIPEYAFYGCDMLKSVEFHEDVTSIGEVAFGNCYALESAELPAGLTYLGSYAFTGTSLAEVTIPAAITELKAGVFEYCRKLKSVVFPENLTSIGEACFAGTGFEVFEVPAGVTVIEEGTFRLCSSLVEVILPENLTSIGDYAFRNCSSLAYVDIPYGVMSVGMYAFDQCSALSLVGLPGSIEDIGPGAFYLVDNAFFVTERDCAALDYCKANDKMILLEPNAESDFTVSNLTSKTCRITGYKGTAVDVFLPDTIGGRTVTEIGSSAFKGKTAIKSVSILNGVTTIKSSAFSGCTSLSYMQMTSGVTSIADTAFDGCDQLEKIIVVQFEEAAEAMSLR